ncbi:major facilitator superfamily transporter [Mycena floridula]|nr:major facilitator superfamily transporter [Mycena floridula]
MTNDRSSNEETPLLARKPRKPTPLPMGQITLLMLLQICEPITSQSIYPYINQLVSELDIVKGDEKKTGYYAGLIESLFFVTEALTVLQWSRMSDYIGRKPVILIGLLGTTISMLLFGLSRTFWALVISRCLTGLLNGNVGVMKSLVGDLTDSTNRARGISLLPVVWSFGATVGPLLGGGFARPHERFPRWFSGRFWVDYPYFLPCVATASVVMIIAVIALFFLKETVPRTRSQKASDVDEANRRPEQQPLPLREILTFPVIISVSNYVALAFLNIALLALFPLFLAMPISIGGMDMEPASIGYIMGVYGAFNGIFQFFFFAKVIGALGEWRVFRNGVISFIPLFAIPPIMSYFAKQNDGISVISYVFLALFIFLATIMDLAYGAIFMFVIASAPNKRSMGSTNGLSQTTASIARAIGPAMATSLFSLSVEGNYLGGYAVYLFFIGLTFLVLVLVGRLPKEVWEETDR